MKRVVSSIAAVVLIAGCYVGGAATSAFTLFPYDAYLKPAFEAIRARKKRRELTDQIVVETGLWADRGREGERVVQSTPGEMSSGLTLYASAHEAAAHLVDEEGNRVHTWKKDFRDVWSDPPHVSNPVPSSNIHFRDVHLYPNGDLLATFGALGDTPYGYGVVRLDRDSNVLWKKAINAHHHLSVEADGSIYVLDQSFRDTRAQPVEGASGLPRRVLVSTVVELAPSGKTRDRTSLLNALEGTPYVEMLQSFPKTMRSRGPLNAEPKWDLFHTNTVDEIGADFAEHHDFAHPGQVMISFRSTDAIALIDTEEDTIDWLGRGFWMQQHDPDPLGNGHVMLFDNLGHGGPEGGSRILETDPETQAVEWSYAGSYQNPLWSRGRCSKQPLPNGNVLITESEAGRILEVTRAGEIVWSFQNPAQRQHEGDTFIAIVHGAKRYPRDHLDVPFET